MLRRLLTATAAFAMVATSVPAAAHRTIEVHGMVAELTKEMIAGSDPLEEIEEPLFPDLYLQETTPSPRPCLNALHRAGISTEATPIPVPARIVALKHGVEILKARREVIRIVRDGSRKQLTPPEFEGIRGLPHRPLFVVATEGLRLIDAMGRLRLFQQRRDVGLEVRVHHGLLSIADWWVLFRSLRSTPRTGPGPRWGDGTGVGRSRRSGWLEVFQLRSTGAFARSDRSASAPSQTAAWRGAEALWLGPFAASCRRWWLKAQNRA